MKKLIIKDYDNYAIIIKNCNRNKQHDRKQNKKKNNMWIEY